MSLPTDSSESLTMWLRHTISFRPMKRWYHGDSFEICLESSMCLSYECVCERVDKTFVYVCTNLCLFALRLCSKPIIDSPSAKLQKWVILYCTHFQILPSSWRWSQTPKRDVHVTFNIYIYIYILYIYASLAVYQFIFVSVAFVFQNQYSRFKFVIHLPCDCFLYCSDFVVALFLGWIKNPKGRALSLNYAEQWQWVKSWQVMLNLCHYCDVSTT